MSSSWPVLWWPIISTIFLRVATQSWNVASFSNDLACNGDAEDLVSQGQYTTCNSTEIVSSLVTVGTCEPCVDVAYATGTGYYCDGSGSVSLCPDNHYCPTPNEKFVCPEGQWCRPGFVSPQDCPELRTCPGDGTTETAAVPFLISFAWVLTCVCGCSCCLCVRRTREEHFAKVKAAELEDETIVLGAGFKQETPPVSLQFDQLSMTLKSSGAVVLKDITGSFPEASLVALMGPSGGGKTTFMNAMCGRASYGNVSGVLCVNQKPCNIADISKVVGFVPQDDIMHPDLTVQQNIFYNALLRLPSTMVRQNRDKVWEHANQVVKILGLERVADNLVGDPEKRGISGGQKKRVNIGMELAAMPAVIFMDEPTSGLDGAATVQLAACLANLRQSGLTIVCVIHQPRWAVYSRFSHLLLLGAGGQMVYCGEALKIQAYFEGLFFRLPENETPADWMIDIVSGLSVRFLGQGADAERDTSFTAPDDLFRLWNERCRNTDHPWMTHEKKDLPAVHNRITPNRFWQIWFFLRREVLKFNGQGFVRTCLVYGIMGFVFGQLSSNETGDFEYKNLPDNAAGYGVTLIFNMGITIAGRGIFAPERLQYIREFSSGTSVTSYFISKNLFYLLQLFLCCCTFAFGLYYTMPLLAMNFGPFMTMMFMAGWYHSGLGLLVAITISNAQTSLLLCIFYPLALDIMWELTIENAPFIAALSCGRWFNMDLFLLELTQYPEHIREFTAISDELDVYSLEASDVEDTSGQGLVAILVWGIVFRTAAWIALLLMKYSEGTGCVSRLRFLIVKQLKRLGIDSLLGHCGPKAKDVEDKPTYHRKPTLTFGVSQPEPEKVA